MLRQCSHPRQRDRVFRPMRAGAPPSRPRMAASMRPICAAKAGIKAVILCDAGVGRERAGHRRARLSRRARRAAAPAFGHRTARIGDGADCCARGAHHVRQCAGRGARHRRRAWRHAKRSRGWTRADLPALPAAAADRGDAPSPDRGARRGGVRVLAIDSAGLVLPDDAGHIVVTGSHGGLLGGRPETAVKIAVFAALYNDADFGIDDAGISRLPALDARGIAGACVSAWTRAHRRRAIDLSRRLRLRHQRARARRRRRDRHRAKELVRALRRRAR